MKVEKFGASKYIMVAQDSNYVALPAQIKGTAGATIKAGTPLVGGLDARDTGFTVATADNATSVVGILLHDVTIPTGATATNGVIVIEGTVDLLKLDSTVVTALSTAVRGALKGSIKFIKGAK